MILGFKPHFKAPILAGTKIHTLRDDEHDRWQAGKHIHFATGVRTAAYECFKEADCISTQEVFMTWFPSRGLEISIDGTELFMFDLMQFYNNDGFASYEDFENWFTPLVKKAGGSKTFKLIHWTDYRY